MSAYQEKFTRHIKRQKTHCEQTDQASDPDMEETLELLDNNKYAKISNG